MRLELSAARSSENSLFSDAMKEILKHSLHLRLGSLERVVLHGKSTLSGGPHTPNVGVASVAYKTYTFLKVHDETMLGSRGALPESTISLIQHLHSVQTTFLHLKTAF